MVATTTAPAVARRTHCYRVVSVDLTSTSSTYVRDFVIAGVNAPSGSATGSKTFNAPDNLASAAGGSKASWGYFFIYFSALLTVHTTLAVAIVLCATSFIRPVATSVIRPVAWH
eukprot:19123-Heterococcus_DN1.PRE.4